MNASGRRTSTRCRLDPKKKRARTMPDDRSPVTKQDLSMAIDSLEQRLTETMRDMQTEMLRAFS